MKKKEEREKRDLARTNILLGFIASFMGSPPAATVSRGIGTAVQKLGYVTRFGIEIRRPDF